MHDVYTATALREVTLRGVFHPMLTRKFSEFLRSHCNGTKSGFLAVVSGGCPQNV